MGKMILSVSRRTDIPNYYSEWFFNRIEEGYLYVRNPMSSRQVSKISLSPDKISCIVFWTKNPKEMMKRLDELDNKYKNRYYFQFTINGYGKEVEPNLPDIKERINTFQELSKKIGKDRVIWRYDPILLNKIYTIKYHINTFKDTAEKLRGYTNNVVINFIDLYEKTKRNTKNLNLEEISENKMVEIVEELKKIAKKNEMKIETCTDKIDLKDIGIDHATCINKDLIEQITNCELKVSKDKQRNACECFKCDEVGKYNTCLNACKYCYANFNNKKVEKNYYENYDPKSPFLCDNGKEDYKITERKGTVKEIKGTQTCLI